MTTSRTGTIARIFLPLILLVSGCSNPPPPPPPVPPFVPTSARLILFRPYNLISMGNVGVITVNGTPSCDLPNGTGFVKDVPPGSVTITGAMGNPSVFQVGPSTLTFSVAAGQSYYMKFTPSGEDLGALGTLVELASVGQAGPFNIYEGTAADLGKIKPVGCAAAG